MILRHMHMRLTAHNTIVNNEDINANGNKAIAEYESHG